MIMYFIMAFLGLALKTLQKIQGLKRTFEKSNEQFLLSKYFKSEAIALAISILIIGIVTFTVDEIAKFKPQVLVYVKLFFVAVGWMGTDIMLALLGGAKSYILKIIDHKTNIADDKVNP